MNDRDDRQAMNYEGGETRRPQRARDDRTADTLLDRLEAELLNAKSVPFSDRCMVEREEMLFLVRMIREGLPEELERAKWVLQQNRQLINQARREADSIMRDAEAQMARMLDEHEITQQAMNNASVLIEDATRQSQEIHQGALQYAHEMMTNLENHLTDILVNITRNKKNLGESHGG
ncbi:MAG TPA: ATP synthase F0 subunit B [Clostridiaceae bacterium]|nr:ATP synthase F0 subunit B [Clostridiaceae bacterium]